MRFFHRTRQESAERILADGFMDHTDTYGCDSYLTGVWLSDVPLDCNDGTSGQALLLVDFDAAEDDLAEFEVLGDRRDYREWVIPAAFINAKAKVRYATEDEEEAGDVERMARGQRILEELPPDAEGASDAT